MYKTYFGDNSINFNDWQLYDKVTFQFMISLHSNNKKYFHSMIIEKVDP